MATNVTAVQESGAAGDGVINLGDNFISIHGRQVRTEDGAIVTEITALDYVLRFLILGQTELSYEPGRRGELKSKDETKVRKDIETLIQKGKGQSVVNLIKKIATNYRNISQDPVIYCLALCARSDDVTTKKEAYQILNDICRIPTHLFQFIEYYTRLTQERCSSIDNKDVKKNVKEKEDRRKTKLEKKEAALEKKNEGRKKHQNLKMKKVNPHNAYGWGRLFKAAITKWFLSFESDPGYLAYLLTKYRRRCGWSVKAVIRLAHIKSPDRSPNNCPTEKQKALGLILRYFRSNLKNAVKEYPVEGLEEGSIVKETYLMLKDYDDLRKDNTDISTVQAKVRCDIELAKTRQYHTITIEHLSTKVLSRQSEHPSTEILSRKSYVGLWRDLVQSMPGDALIRHTGFLTSIGVWSKLGDESDEVRKAAIDGFETRLQQFIQPPTAPDDQRPFTTKRPVHPFRILIAALHYSKNRASRWGRAWIPLEAITQILHRAFAESLGYNPQVITSKICIAIDVSGWMATSGINGKSWAMTCQEAAQAVAFTLAKMGANTQLLAFNEKGHVALQADDDFNKFVDDIGKIALQYSQISDCTEPLKWAQKEERKDIDAFVVFTVNRNVGDRNEVVEALKLYREFSGKDDAKFIVCTMNDTKITSGDPSDPHVYNICGCDTNLSHLIQEYLLNEEPNDTR